MKAGGQTGTVRNYRNTDALDSVPRAARNCLTCPRCVPGRARSAGISNASTVSGKSSFAVPTTGLHLLEKLAPFRQDYRHHRTGETNGDSHLKSLLVHHQVIVPVTAGKLDFGPWQQIYYAEFDGMRPKRVIIKVMGE